MKKEIYQFWGLALFFFFFFFSLVTFLLFFPKCQTLEACVFIGEQHFTFKYFFSRQRALDELERRREREMETFKRVGFKDIFLFVIMEKIYKLHKLS